jgi:cyclic di-GMP phosphodiesterase
MQRERLQDHGMETAKGQPLTNGMRLLIVDDEISVCMLLSQKLTRAGYRCSTATSALRALELINAEQFDAIISDMRMPGMTGLELLAQVHEKYPDIAFLMATAEDDVRKGVQAMKYGAADYILKPFDLDLVLRGVNRALEKKRLEKELEEYRLHLEEMVAKRTAQLQDALLRIEQTYDETLEALGAALDLRDTETEGHSRRVSLYCLELARRIQCNDEQVKQIARGSYLHDIGKIGIPDSILLKPSKLTPDERVKMEAHAQIGFELVSRIAFLAPAAEIVLTHQERYDGTGYPEGLKGEQIPLGARIFAIADTLDAMTSDRPYRKALPFSAAVQEITRESGRQFDPEVVKAFLSVPEETWKDIRAKVEERRSKKEDQLPKSTELETVAPAMAGHRPSKWRPDAP